MPPDDTTAIERAFQLAASGNCETVTDIKKHLKEQGFSLKQIEGGCSGWSHAARS